MLNWLKGLFAQKQAAPVVANAPQKCGQAGLDLIKQFEGLKLKAYKCPAGVWTIGYGHTKTAKQGMVITEAQALDLLHMDLVIFEKAVRNKVKVPLTQNQFDALVSFVFNIGTGAFSKSTLLRLLNRGGYSQVPMQIMRWTQAGGKVLKGLVNRRKAEAELFVK